MTQQATTLTCGHCAHLQPAQGEMGALGFSVCPLMPAWLSITQRRPACPKFTPKAVEGKPC